MNTDQIKGTLKDAAGKVQQKAGELIDSPEQQAKGIAKQVEGTAQKKLGDVKEVLKDAKNKAFTLPLRTSPPHPGGLFLSTDFDEWACEEGAARFLFQTACGTLRPGSVATCTRSRPACLAAYSRPSARVSASVKAVLAATGAMPKLMVTRWPAAST